VKITRLQPQAKRPDRVSVFIDDKYAFSLTRDQVAELELKLGQEVDPIRIRQFLADSVFGKLRDQTYRWLAIRLRSRWEIETYLARKTEDEKLRQRLLTLLDGQGYVDDAKFAAAWVRHRNLIKPMSQYRLKQELLQKRLPMEIIEEALSEQPQDDIAAIRSLVAKRGHRYPDRQKLMAFLARQGFKYADIKTALSERE